MISTKHDIRIIPASMSQTDFLNQQHSAILCGWFAVGQQAAYTPILCSTQTCWQGNSSNHYIMASSATAAQDITCHQCQPARNCHRQKQIARNLACLV